MCSDEYVRNPPKYAKRRNPRNCVSHLCLRFHALKLVNVSQGLKRARNHFIRETTRALKLNDLRGYALSKPEVSAFKSNQIAELQ